MKKYSLLLFTFFVLLLQPVLKAQTYTLVKEIPIKGRYLEMDNLGNSYVVNEKNELHKFKPNGQFVQFFSEVKFGKIGFIDVLNPLKPIIYYPGFNTLRILDVTLSDKGSLNLMQLGFDRVNAMCLSLSGDIWIYDEIEFRLKKINENLEIIMQSEGLTTLLQMPVKANYILEKDNWLMLNDPKIGILVFDIYATYNKTIPIKGLNDFQKIKDNIYYFQDGKMQSFNLKTLQYNEIVLPKINEAIIDVKIESAQLSILTENQLLLYSF